ncbi:hypothetical protein RRG08_036316 [Elysia crispata]|uniref:Uncharacterized protein n=1 Tax=Elysia crispata TaxID=231223 RepID=A0AAE1DJP0_9GAST|nr:hypothetical protein RRG08_036316 [Elysia crispata]
MRTSVCLFAFHRSPGTDLHFPITVVCVSVQQDSYDEPVVSFTVLIPMAPPRDILHSFVMLFAVPMIVKYRAVHGLVITVGTDSVSEQQGIGKPLQHQNKIMPWSLKAESFALSQRFLILLESRSGPNRKNRAQHTPLDRIPNCIKLETLSRWAKPLRADQVRIERTEPNTHH